MMSRRLYVLAFLLTGAAIGVLGFQVFNYWITGNWAMVPFHTLWEPFFGRVPDYHWMSLGRVFNWVGAVPMAAAMIVLAYLVFLASDTLRRR
ncbi:MAG: hypothetical protein JSR21_07340 [Proteobacteria bacterium]|nr:hypothetical protein [Pseudomonadota bacterium]